jgi:uncharacterized protein (TIGR00255 family)
VAYLADRCDITEEIVRMESHVEQFESTMAADASVGRRLDFIIQEMNREVNTIGSKTNDNSISEAVIELKSEIARMREQVQNIE